MFKFLTYLKIIINNLIRHYQLAICDVIKKVFGVQTRSQFSRPTWLSEGELMCLYIYIRSTARELFRSIWKLVERERERAIEKILIGLDFLNFFFFPKICTAMRTFVCKGINFFFFFPLNHPNRLCELNSSWSQISFIPNEY